MPAVTCARQLVAAPHAHSLQRPLEIRERIRRNREAIDRSRAVVHQRENLLSA